MKELTPYERLLAAQCAERHRIPVTDIVHPKVFAVSHNGEVDEFMTAKLREPHYVPYCLKRTDCGRVRRTDYGFKCPTCGNQMNYDLSHYDGNVNVRYDGPPPVPDIKTWNANVEARRRAKAERRTQWLSK